MASFGFPIRGALRAMNIARGALANGGMKGGVGLYEKNFLRALARTTKRDIRYDARSSTQQVVRGRTTTFFTRNTKKAPSGVLQQLRMRFFHTTRARRSMPESKTYTGPHEVPKPEPVQDLTLGQRMKKLSREYGWSAVGVYFLLSALDFPFCYLLVKTLGTDRIGEWEHLVISNIQKLIPEKVQTTWHEWRTAVKQAEQEVTGSDEITKHVEMVGWGVEEAAAEHKSHASLATQLALAYAIHKSFIFIRVPLTAAVTPNVVKVLRSWGWDIGKRTTKAAKAAKRAQNAA